MDALGLYLTLVYPDSLFLYENERNTSNTLLSRGKVVVCVYKAVFAKASYLPPSMKEHNTDEISCTTCGGGWFDGRV